MTKIICKLFLFSVLLLLLTGCSAWESGSNSTGGSSVSSEREEKAMKDDKVYVTSLDFALCSPNAYRTYYAQYPFAYYFVDQISHKNCRIDMKDECSNWIPRSVFDEFVAFQEAHAEESAQGGPLTYSISISYYDENEEMAIRRISGYNGFPEDLDLIITRFNELCGQTVLTDPEEVMEITPEFLMAEYGIEEGEYPYEDVAAMIEQEDASFFAFFSRIGTFDGYMEKYYAGLAYQAIEDLLPTELLPAVEVSDEEFADFVDRLVKALGEDWSVMAPPDGAHSFATLRFQDANVYMTVGRSADLGSVSPEFDSGYGVVYLDAGMEGMTLRTEFVYNADGKYFLADFQGKEDFDTIVRTFAEFK